MLIVEHFPVQEQNEHIRFLQNQEQEVLTFWENEMEGYRRIIDFLVGNFTVQCISFEKREYHYEDYEDDEYYEDYEVFLEYLEYSKSRGIKFDKVHISEGSWREGMAERMLSACSGASELDLMLKTDQNFTFNGFHEFKMDKFEVFLIGGQWFSVDHMCALINCSEVIVKNLSSHWDAVHFNQFLKFWLRSTGRLRTVDMNGYNSESDPEMWMNGINHIKLNQDSTFQIQRDDGMKAKVEFSSYSFSLNVIDA